MALELELGKDQVLAIKDINNDTVLHFIFDEPDSDEIIKYRSAITKKSVEAALGNKTNEDVQWVQTEFGLKKIKGLAEGDLTIKGKPVSTDPKSENYYSEWREILKKNFAYLIIRFTEQIFENKCMIVKNEAANADFFDGNTAHS
jgi:hypothetical protein